MSKLEFKQNKKEISLKLSILRSNTRRVKIHIDTNCMKPSENEYEELDQEDEESDEDHNYDESDIDEISNDDIYYESEQEIELNDDEIESV
jgi:hypothetical protein